MQSCSLGYMLNTCESKINEIPRSIFQPEGNLVTIGPQVPSRRVLSERMALGVELRLRDGR